MKLFVYGTLKPGEPGNYFFGKNDIEVFREEEARLKGFTLHDWDGLPIAMAVSSDDLDAESGVVGYLLEIRGDDASGVLDKLDKYELGIGNHIRPLKREKVTVSTHSGEHEAWVFVFNSSSNRSKAARRLRTSHKITDGNWTMAEDAIFKSIFPVVYRNLQQHLENKGSSSIDENHVELLGQFLVLYSCLERFCLHRFGPRRYDSVPDSGQSGDRVPVQQLLHKEYFATGAPPAWFHPLSNGDVYDSTTMKSFRLSERPTFFWATIRNNSAHQGKSPREHHVQLLKVAAASLADFLALALVNLDTESDFQAQGTGRISNVSARLKQLWSQMGFNPVTNYLQNFLKEPTGL